MNITKSRSARICMVYSRVQHEWIVIVIVVCAFISALIAESAVVIGLIMVVLMIYLSLDFLLLHLYRRSKLPDALISFENEIYLFHFITFSKRKDKFYVQKVFKMNKAEIYSDPKSFDIIEFIPEAITSIKDIVLHLLLYLRKVVAKIILKRALKTFKIKISTKIIRIKIKNKGIKLVITNDLTPFMSPYVMKDKFYKELSSLHELVSLESVLESIGTNPAPPQMPREPTGLPN